MKASIYSFIENDLRNLSLQTALLESCDWDEALLEELPSLLQMAFHFIEEQSVSYEEGKSLLKEILELNGMDNGQYDIIIKLMEHQKEEIIAYMKLEEQ